MYICSSSTKRQNVRNLYKNKHVMWFGFTTIIESRTGILFAIKVMAMFSNSEFQNWIKACLAIKCVKDGMIPLVEHYCIKHSTDNIEHVLKTCNISRYTCNQCDIKTLKPFHKRGQCMYRRCDCKNNVRQTCPENEACGVIYDQIKAMHAFNDPNWLNTDSTMWSICPWEQMKCYIATPGYKETKTICDADITALVQISLNNREINALIGTSSGYLHEVHV